MEGKSQDASGSSSVLRAAGSSGQATVSLTVDLLKMLLQSANPNIDEDLLLAKVEILPTPPPEVEPVTNTETKEVQRDRVRRYREVLKRKPKNHYLLWKRSWKIYQRAILRVQRGRWRWNLKTLLKGQPKLLLEQERREKCPLWQGKRREREQPPGMRLPRQGQQQYISTRGGQPGLRPLERKPLKSH